MKKIILLTLVTLSFVACKKQPIAKNENLKQGSNSERVINSSSDKMMVFKSTEEYEKYFSLTTEEQKNYLKELKRLPFVSLNESANKTTSEDLIDDDFMKSILNEDNIVQIGDFLYKINMKEEKVYVLPSSRINQYTDLVNQNLNNRDIRKFSIYENVIELAEAGELSEKALFCRDSHANSRSEHVGPFVEIGYMQTLNFDCNVLYRAFGVYFTLKATLNAFTQGLSWNDLNNDQPQYYSGSAGLYLKIEGERKYKERCGSEPSGFYVMPAATGYTSIQMQSYQGSKGLNKYQMMCNFFVYNSKTDSWTDLNTLPRSQGWDMYPPYVTGVKYGF